MLSPMFRPIVRIVSVNMQRKLQCLGAFCQYSLVGNDGYSGWQRMSSQHDAEIYADAGRLSRGDDDAWQFIHMQA